MVPIMDTDYGSAQVLVLIFMGSHAQGAMDPEMEQLLHEQETFLRSKQAPAAKVVRRRPEGNGKPAVSAFKAAVSGAEGAGGVKKPIMDMPSVVGAVVERQEGGERAASRPPERPRYTGRDRLQSSAHHP